MTPRIWLLGALGLGIVLRLLWKLFIRRIIMENIGPDLDVIPMDAFDAYIFLKRVHAYLYERVAMVDENWGEMDRILNQAERDCYDAWLAGTR